MGCIYFLKEFFMKNSIRIFGIIALVAVIGFTACDTGGGGGGGGGSAYLGDEPVLSGKVYTVDWDISGAVYRPFTETVTLRGWDDGGVGGITNGNLSYTLGTPRNLFWIRDINDDIFKDYDVVNADDTSVRYYYLSLSTPDYDFLYREEDKISIKPSSYSSTNEQVFYVYVDGDVTVSGRGWTDSYSEEYGGTTYNEIITSANFSLDLKQGWNAVYTKRSTSGTFTGSSAAPTSVTSTLTITWALKNPALKWVLY
jgi:hypothetical protein